MSEGGIVGAIPARYASTRLPGKPLLDIAGRPMIEHVYRRVSGVPGLSRAVVLTDDERIASAVRGFGGEVEMTSAACASGTDRIASVLDGWRARAVVNIQGDEPLIDVEAVTRVVEHLHHSDDPMVTLAAPFPDSEDLADANKVKVTLDLRGYALYFSRAPIPYPRATSTELSNHPWLHVGIYGYQTDTLRRLASFQPTPLERRESLEQLRALEHGIPIRVLTLDQPTHPGVDTAGDLERVARALATGQPGET